MLFKHYFGENQNFYIFVLSDFSADFIVYRIYCVLIMYFDS